MSKLRIFGSHGDFDIDSETGVPSGHEGIEEYSDITKFDVSEYKTWCKKNKFDDTVLALDILVIGYWYTKGDTLKYEPPEDEYRKLVVEGWPQPVIDNGTVAELVGGQ